jgi:hypothetical protein
MIMKPITMDWYAINEAAVAHVGKPAVYIANHISFEEPGDADIWSFVVESLKTMFGAVGDQYTQEYLDVISQVIHGGLFFFETKEEQYAFYKIFEQPLTESGPIYACTYSAEGKGETENT